VNLIAPRVLLRLEGLTVFAAAIAVYLDADYSVVALVALFLVPDVSFLGYLVSPRVGSVSYNAVHSFVGAITLGTVGVLADAEVPKQLALIWLAHIGVDRALGYGLKYPREVKESHLQRV
jgi:Domain of unknown function (DUF4260)